MPFYLCAKDARTRGRAKPRDDKSGEYDIADHQEDWQRHGQFEP
jgi:hypothetical protein